MNNSFQVCKKCFPSGANVVQQAFLDIRTAMHVYEQFHLRAQQPVLCGDADKRFRVCHEPTPVRCSERA